MNRERNKIVHGRWIQTEKPHIVLRITSRAPDHPVEERTLMTAKSIGNFAKQVVQLAEDLSGAYLDIGLILHPDPSSDPTFSVDL